MSTSPNDICVYLFHHHFLTWCLPLSLCILFSMSLTSPCVLPPHHPSCLDSLLVNVSHVHHFHPYCYLQASFWIFQFFCSYSLSFSLLVWILCTFASPNRKTHLSFWFVGLIQFGYNPNKRWITWLPIATPCLQGLKKMEYCWVDAVTRQVSPFSSSPLPHVIAWSLLLTKSKINMPCWDTFQLLVD